jgi:beta-glucanase (GH16 family)
LKTEGKLSVSYGRIEARIKLPKGQGLCPAFWLLSNDSKFGSPVYSEMDVMEHINEDDSISGTLHAARGEVCSRKFPASTDQSFSASDWHVYGMIWSKGSIKFYVDCQSNVYASCLSGPTRQSGATWPFDSGDSAYVILNLAVGGVWPGSPDGSTPFPSEMLVDYVRVYTN